MNQRQVKKNNKKILLLLLGEAVSVLDKDGGKYKAHALRVPFIEIKTLTRVSGYRVEIRSSREDNHNYAHFHVVKGTDGVASIKIESLEVLESSLPKKDLNRILEWASTHKELLVATWNEFHGYRVIVE